MSELYALRMTSGEDVLAKVEDTGEVYELSDAVVMIPSQNGQLQFIPYSPFTEKNKPVSINPSFVVFKETPSQDIADHHREMFSGIVVAS